MAGRHSAVRAMDPATLSPRVKMALRLYGTGTVRSLADAARAAGLHHEQLYGARYKDPRMDIFLLKLDKEINDGTVDMTQVLQKLGRRAIVNIAQLSEEAQKEDIRLRANQDLADRSPETAKTHKVALEQDIRMTPESIEDLRRALLESARAKETYAEVLSGDYVTVDAESSVRHLKQLPALAESNGTGHSVP